MANGYPEPNWDTCSGKYAYGALGKTEVLFIVPSLSSQSPAEVVPRRPREELSEDEWRKLEHQGVPRECHHDNLSIMTARYNLDKLKRISGTLTGDSVTCEQVRKHVGQLMNNTELAGGKEV